MPSLCLLLLLPVQVDARPPTARVDFPLPSALTDAHELRVRGAASDASGVAAVRVNGVPASTADGYATWTALVPLEVGENALVVETLDALGNLDPAAAATVVRRDEVIVWRPFEVTVSPSGDHAAIGEILYPTPDQTSGFRISLVDLATDEIELLSSKDKGVGPLPQEAREIEFDASGSRLIVPASNLQSLLAVDLTTGDRTVVSGPDLGTGPELGYTHGLAIDPLGQRAWVTRDSQTSGNAVIEIDLATGDRKLVADATRGSGPWPSLLRGMDLQPGGTRLVVATFGTSGILSIDPASGDRSFLSTAEDAIGLPWILPWDACIEPGGRAWVSDANQGMLFGVDLSSGSNVVLNERDHPLGVFGDLHSVDLDPRRGRVLAADVDSGGILGLDLESHVLSFAFRTSQGDGPGMKTAGELEPLDPVGSRWVVLDRFRRAVVEFDLRTGQRKILSGPTRGTGPDLIGAVDVAVWDAPGAKQLLVLDVLEDALVRVDVDTGDRTVLSGDAVGNGLPFANPAWIVAAPDGERAIVADVMGLFGDVALIEVDLVTGDRSPFSDASHGSGPRIVSAADMLVDAVGNRILLSSQGAVLAVDLATGDRSVVSSATVGSGPAFQPGRLAWDPLEEVLLASDHLKGVLRIAAATGDREVILPLSTEVGPGYVNPAGFEIVRPAGAAWPLLVYSDFALAAIGVIDLALDEASGSIPGWRTIVSR